MLLNKSGVSDSLPAFVVSPSAWNASPADLQGGSPSRTHHQMALYPNFSVPASSLPDALWTLTLLSCRSQRGSSLTLDISVVNPLMKAWSFMFSLLSCILCAGNSPQLSVSTVHFLYSLCCGVWLRLLTLFPPVLTEIMDEVMIIIGSG